MAFHVFELYLSIADTIPGGNVNPLIFREMKNLVKNNLDKGKMSLYVRQLLSMNTTEIHPDTQTSL